MPRKSTRKVWVDEDGDGHPSDDEIIENAIVEDVIEDVVEEPVVEEPVVVVPKKKKVSDSERRRKRHLGF